MNEIRWNEDEMWCDEMKWEEKYSKQASTEQHNQIDMTWYDMKCEYNTIQERVECSEQE